VLLCVGAKAKAQKWAFLEFAKWWASILRGLQGMGGLAWAVLVSLLVSPYFPGCRGRQWPWSRALPW